MLQNIFIIVFGILAVVATIYYLHFCEFEMQKDVNKHEEGLECINDPVATMLQKKVVALNENIRSQSYQTDVIKNAFRNISELTNKFQFIVGSILVTDSKGPALVINGDFPNPTFNFKFTQPPTGDAGFTGHVGSYGVRGIPGSIGDKGPDGYWGGLQ